MQIVGRTKRNGAVARIESLGQGVELRVDGSKWQVVAGGLNFSRQSGNWKVLGEGDLGFPWTLDPAPGEEES